MSGLPIREVAEQTGLAAGTIRMWEQRYGFPSPERTPAGYRLYAEKDVETLRRVVDLRRGGLSVPAALERARTAAAELTEHPSIFGAVGHAGRARPLRKRTLVAMSRAIEEQTMASASRPLVLAAFQREGHYRAAEHRYRRIAEAAELAVVFADFGRVVDRGDGAPVEVPIDADKTIGHEWAVVVDAPGFCACLVAWEPPVATPPASELDRVFETYWTLDPEAVRQASRAGAVCARESSPAVAERIEALLLDRPRVLDSSTASLEALTARMIGYLESS